MLHLHTQWEKIVLRGAKLVGVLVAETILPAFMCEGGGRGGEGGGRAFYTYNNKAVRYERGHGPCGKKKKVNDALSVRHREPQLLWLDPPRACELAAHADMAADHSRPVTSASSVAPAPQHLLCVHYTCICTRPDATLVPCAQGMLPSVPPSAQGRRLRESLTSSHSILSQSSHASSMVRLCTCLRLGSCVRRQMACARNTIVPPTLTSCSSHFHQSTHRS